MTHLNVETMIADTVKDKKKQRDLGEAKRQQSNEIAEELKLQNAKSGNETERNPGRERWKKQKRDLGERKDQEKEEEKVKRKGQNEMKKKKYDKNERKN